MSLFLSRVRPYRARKPQAQGPIRLRPMHDTLLRFMGVPLGEDQVALIRSLFVPRSLERGRFFQRAGQVPTRGAFVVRGLFRTYVIDERGREQILAFSPEDAWVGDLQSATTSAPTPYFVEALEPSDVLTIDLPSVERMLAAIPAAADGFRKDIQRALAARDRRLLSSLHSTATERYAAFVERRPALAARVPLHMLASYLGIAPETLSRIRAKRKDR
jgi:CRP-like cAMP-binding protein